MLPSKSFIIMCLVFMLYDIEKIAANSETVTKKNIEVVIPQKHTDNAPDILEHTKSQLIPVKRTNNKEDVSLSSVLSLSNNLTNGTGFDNVTTPSANKTTVAMTTLTTKGPTHTASDHEHQLSLTLFFILIIVGVCILLVHAIITAKIHFLPESIAIVGLGAIIGLLLQLIGNWRKEEAFPPTMFFLVLLPPIIFESGYNLHKGNFFQNLGSIMVFAILGTAVSAIIIGSGLYLCGVANLTYQLDLAQSFAFGSLISAVDPVATLAIFQAIEVDPVLYMLVFGESILNDAVSIVLVSSIMTASHPSDHPSSALETVGHAVGNFLITFLASAGLGVLTGLLSALVLKWMDLRRTPSLELGFMLIFAYTPYCLAEGLSLSGIMAILFAGIVMSHYTHHNLSPVTQITVQQIFRTIAFLAETCMFAYLGMAIFSFKHRVEPALVVWCLVLCLVGRALNIFPLSCLVNRFREHKIPLKNQFIMWFSGLRGAIAFALSLHMEVDSEIRQVMVTTTLIVVLVTILLFGGGAMPMIKFVDWCSQLTSTVSRRYRSKDGVSGEDIEGLVEGKTRRRKSRRARGVRRLRRQGASGRREDRVTLSKTQGMGEAVDSESTLAELTEAELPAASDVSITGGRALPESSVKGFLRLDARYFMPFFTRRYTREDLMEGREQVTSLYQKWYQAVRSGPSEEEEDAEEWEETEALAPETKDSGTSRIPSHETSFTNGAQSTTFSID